jgi:hypothetical protein
MNKPNTPPTSQGYIALFSQYAPPWMALLEEEWLRQSNQLSTLQGTADMPPAPDLIEVPTRTVASPDTTLLSWLGNPTSGATPPPAPTVPAPRTETAGTDTPASEPPPSAVGDDNGEGGDDAEAIESGDRSERDETPLPEGEASEDSHVTPEEGRSDDTPETQAGFDF